jgi:hypothetical protein
MKIFFVSAYGAVTGGVGGRQLGAFGGHEGGSSPSARAGVAAVPARTKLRNRMLSSFFTVHLLACAVRTLEGSHPISRSGTETIFPFRVRNTELK